MPTSSSHSGVHVLADVVPLHEVLPTPAPPVAVPGPVSPTTDLNAPELFLNRELTYLNFCWRVLHEAEDERNPLLERVKFLAIVASNIDEFFQKRIGGLKQQVGAQLHTVTPDGRTPQQQIADCLELITKLEARKAQIQEKVFTERSEEHTSELQ